MQISFIMLLYFAGISKITIIPASYKCFIALKKGDSHFFFELYFAGMLHIYTIPAKYIVLVIIALPH